MLVGVMCPNTDDPRWTLLLKSTNNDPIQAHNIWEKNGNNYPSYILEQYQTNKDKNIVVDLSVTFNSTSKLLNKAALVLNTEIKRLTKKKDSDKAKFTLNKYNELLKTFQKDSSEVSILSFIKTADNMIKSYNKWLDVLEGADNPYKSLELVIQGLDSLSLINDITEEDYIDFFTTNPDDKIFQSKEQVDNLIRSVISSIVKTRERTLRISKVKLIDEMSPYITRVQAHFEKKAELQFLGQVDFKQYKTKAELNKAKKDYISQYMLDYQPIITQASKSHMENIFDNLEDLSGLVRLTIAPKDMSNDLIGFVTQTLDKLDYQKNLNINAANRKMDKIHKAYIEYVKPTSNNYEDIYSPILIKNPDTGEYFLRDVSNDPQFKVFRAKYDNTPVMDFFDYINEVRAATNSKENLPWVFRLRNGQLPKIERSTMESLYQKGIFQSVKTKFKDTFKVNSRDLDLVDEETTTIKDEDTGQRTIPIRYRFGVEAKDMSLDIPSIIMLDYHNALNFGNKMKVVSMMELLKSTVAESDVIQRDSYSGIMKLKATYDTKMKSDTVKDTKKGIESNLYKALESIIDHRVYGVSMKGNQQMNKIAKGVKNYISKVNMSLNPYSAMTNFVHGQSMVLFDALGEDTGYYGMGNRLNASKKLDMDVLNILKDVNNNTNLSKTNLMFELMGIQDETLKNEYHNDNVIKRSLAKSPLMVLHQFSDYSIKAVAMYSILDNIKVLDGEGNYIDKDGNPTTDRNKGISIDDGLDNIDGELVLKFDNIVKTERTDDLNLFPIANILGRTLRDKFGNYFSPENKSELERTAIGSLVYHMRGWLLPGMKRRWGGLSSARVKREDLTMEQQTYNTETGKFEEGSYVTMIRFMNNLVTDIKAHKAFMLSDNFKRLTSDEKANIYKAVAEGSAIMAFGILAAIFSSQLRDNDDDEEDGGGLLFLAYSSRRIYSELFSFGNPRELFRTFTTPAVSVSFSERVINLGVAMLATEPYSLITEGDLRKYETGSRSGDYKITHMIAKVVPVWSQLDRDTKESLQFLER